MSAQYPPINISKNNKKQQQQKIKEKCYQILQSNHSTLWQHFLISILNHIDYSYKTTNININTNKKSKLNTEQQWLQQEIELILEWISNPSNRIKSIQYSMYVQKMEKEKKEWFVAIQRLLDEQSVLRERFEEEVQELRNRVREVQEFSETLKVKNSVQQQIIQAMKNIEQKKSIRKNNIDVIGKQRISIKNEVNIQIRSTKDKYQEEFPKMQEKCTMTMQILSKLVETSQDPYLSKVIHNSSVFDIHLSPKLKRLSLQKIPHTSCISPKKYTTQTAYNNNKISQTVCQTVCQTTSACSRQPAAKKAEQETSRSQIKNRQTQCTEQDEQSQLEQNQQQSQQSSYVLQVDHGTQTSNVQMKQMSLQTDFKFIDNQVRMGSLLRKISLLEIDVFNKDREILGKQQQIGDFQHKVQCMNRQILELKADIQINQQIQEHLQSSYEKQKSQNIQLTQKYNQILSTLSTYLSIKPPLIQQQSQTDPNEALTLSLTPHKQQIYDDQLLTNQSEQEQHQLMKKKDIISQVDKETIIRQLLKYMEMEVQDVAFQKKASVFVTILMVLGIEGKEEDVLAKYLAKVGGLNKKKRDCGLEDKLYHYFTDDA